MSPESFLRCSSLQITPNSGCDTTVCRYILLLNVQLYSCPGLRKQCSSNTKRVITWFFTICSSVIFMAACHQSVIKTGATYCVEYSKVLCVQKFSKFVRYVVTSRLYVYALGQDGCHTHTHIFTVLTISQFLSSIIFKTMSVSLYLAKFSY